MFRSRRRRYAWLLTLALALGLALMCCAFAALSDHCCAGHEDCAICACLRAALRYGFSMPAVFATLALAAARKAPLRPLLRICHDTPFSRKVRLND